MKHDLDYYRAIQGMEGAASAKEAEIRAIKFEVLRDFGNSIDCEDVTINGESSSLLITKTTDRTIKNIAAKPDETVYYGDIVHWLSDDWIVDVIDSDDRINIHGKMRRCNIVVRWMDASGTIHAYPGFCEDATKYSEGVTSGKLAQTADFQIKIKIHLDAHSAKIDRGRRFLFDASMYLPEMESVGEHASAYIVTRRNVLTGNHRGHGYVELTLIECAHSENDNDDLMIADYYDPADVYTLTIDNAESNLSLAVGATYALTCTATKNGVPLNQTSIQFKSSDEQIAAISSAGVISAGTQGECVITVSAGKAQKNILLTVADVVPEFEIKIEPIDGSFVIPYGTSKASTISIWTGDIKMPYDLTSTISAGGEWATITDATHEKVVLKASENATAIGKEFTLRVDWLGYGIYAETTFEIGGWW